MVEPTLERSQGLTKRLPAKMWLTSSFSSSKGGKVPSKSHPTARDEDGQTDRWWLACGPVSPGHLHGGPPVLVATLSFSPLNGQGLPRGVVAVLGLSGWGAVMHSS